MDNSAFGEVTELLRRAQGSGLIGPAGVDEQVAHSLGFLDLVAHPLEESSTDRDQELTLLDLGSGGGLPGLVLAAGLTGARVTLLDSSTRRAAWLSEAVDSLQMGDRVEVVCRRAEELGRDQAERGGFSVVTARSFGPPAVTAECSAALLHVGGRLIVSEPPAGSATTASAALAARWPTVEVGLLGFSAPVAREARGRHFAELRLCEPCPPQYPRRVGIPEKRPLFR